MAQDQPNNDHSIKLKKEIPYYQIPDYPEKITAGSSIGRTIDGLGYRYFWATDELRPEDLAYEPGNEGKNAKEVLDHIYGLSLVIKNTAIQKVNKRPAQKQELTWDEKRKATLENFKIASDQLKSKTDDEVANLKIIFQRGDSKSEIPIWNLLNGPIADAIYHVGQIVSYRRSSENPMNPFVNVFMGKTREGGKK